MSEKVGHLDKLFVHYEFPCISLPLSSPLVLEYRSTPLSLRIHPNTQLFVGNLSNFFSGSIDALPGSFVRLHVRDDGAMQGTVHLGRGLGSLHIEPLSNYHHNTTLSQYKNIMYHTADLIATYTHSHLEKRQGAATMDATEYMARIRVALERFLRLLPALIRADNANAGVITTGNNFVPITQALTLADSSSTTRQDEPSTSEENTLPQTFPNNERNFAPVNIANLRNVKRSVIEPMQFDGQIYFDGTNYYDANMQQIYDQQASHPTYVDPMTGQTMYYQIYIDPSTGQATYYQPAPQEATPQSAPSNQNMCEVGLIADYSYYQTHGAGARDRMLSYMSEISGHYEQQLGLSLETSFVYIATGADDYGFNAIPNDADIIVPYINAAAAKIPGMNSDDKCVIVVFSSSVLSGGAVGVSYVGTVCQPGGQTLIVQDRAGTMPSAEMTAIGMHEIGHMFGAGHDEVGGACDPGQNQFVMYPSVSNREGMHILSQCSLNDILQNFGKPEAQCWMPAQRQRSSFRRKRVREGLKAMIN